MLIIILVVVIAGFGVLLWFFNRRSPKSDQSFLMIQEQLSEMRKTMDERMGESTRVMQDVVKTQFGESQKIIKEITKELTEVKESSKQIFNIADQLHSLERVLKNQKQRGNLGEAGLELVLSNILPPDAYKMQYAFKDGDIVDAAIFTKGGIIPVDAKFSLDNYIRITEEKDNDKKAELEKRFRNDLKKRIDETSKYIKPKEKTLQFAFMYIPAEPIFYDLLVNEIGAVKVNTRSLIEYAYRDKKVIIVSPTTFAAYLQTILFGLRAFKIEESAQEIIKRVSDLGRHLKAYDEYIKKVGNHLGTTVKAYNTASKELGKIDKDVYKISDKAMGTEPLTLDRPQQEDE